MTTTQSLITGPNLSLAWAEALCRCHSAPGATLGPAIVEFDAPEFEHGLEDNQIRMELDAHLAATKATKKTIETVAGTIFPESIWNLSDNRHNLYAQYSAAFPRIKRSSRDNRRGVYFERMISYKLGDQEPVNQLEKIISYWNSGKGRRSALQAAIFNPFIDHTNEPRPGFPCLQQLVFYPQGPAGRNGLAVVGFYATQYLIEKGYGNYLGLYRLGKFMAGEMKLKLAKVVCIATALKLGDGTKQSCQDLVDKVKARASELPQ